MKIINTIVITLLISGFFLIDFKPNEVELSVLYNNDIVTVKVSEKEYQKLKLKSENDILFFDGEYFFDSVPNNKEFKAKIVSTKIIEDTSRVVYFYIVVLFLVILAFVNTSIND